ncbi:zinc finger protein 135-like isoform X2 [Dunckerocampus dactyliophorus]|uniref:zinc finger protein 135-like isoform X2 n=1 Tax=Dunckerocampus dactyliophorus TaxID=161453 RepID=UPI0024058D92|nr:zinc finger protein 135-like isoform X2 [Dunckerocampus dactyliophorus]
MATSSQREGGRESAPPTPSTSSTEKKPQTADNEVQKLIGRQEECPTQPQGGGCTWKQGDPKPPHLKEEEEELWTTQDKECLLGSEEPDLTKLPLTGVSLKAEDHEDQEEQHFTESQGWDSTLKQEDPQPPHVNKEQEKLWTTQEGEHELTKLPLTVVSVKTEDHEDKPLESPQLHHSRSEENRGAELPSSSSLQHMTTKADGDHCGGSQADNLLAPLSDSDDTTSHSPEDEAWHDIQEPFSSDPDWEGDMRTHTDNKHTECSKKKTDIQKLNGPQEERPTEAHGWHSTLRQENPQPSHVKKEEEEPQTPHIKEEDEELWITPEGKRLQGREEADPTKLPLTVVSVKTEDHEDKPPESLRWLCPSDVQQLIDQQEQPQEGNSTLKQEAPQSLHIKEEEEELWIPQERECLLHLKKADLTKWPLTVVTVKTEDIDDKPPESSQLHHSPSEENRGAELPSSSSLQHMTTETDENHCGGSQAESLLAPISNSEDEDGEDAQEPLKRITGWEGDMRAHTDNKHSEWFRKETGKKSITCSVCDKSFSYKSRLIRHMWTHTGEKPFICSVCAKSFSFQCDLTRHMLTHTGEKPFSCSSCVKSFSSKWRLTEHMLTHTGEKPFGCSVCGQRFFRKSRMASHMRKHTGEKPEKLFLCSVCAKTFSNKCNLTRHMLTHTGEKSFVCSVCAKSFSFKGDLTRHILTHTGEKPFSCSCCVKRFSSKGHLTRHMRTHTGEKRFSCSCCVKRFSSKDHLSRHMLTHTGEKPFDCSVCSKRFCQKSQILSHMKTHTGEKPFGCSVCAERFSFKCDLTRHMLTHTKEKSFSCSVCPKRFSFKCLLTQHMLTHTGEKRFSCSVCGKRFSFKCLLTQHMLKHTGEKPFSCSDCAKSFFYKGDLKRHMLTHTGEKPFSCSVCAKSFSLNCLLTRHMLTHTGEKPFQCSVCGKSFSFKHHLTYHMPTHTGIKPFGCSVCGQRFPRKSLMVSHMKKHTEKPFSCSVCAQRFSQKSHLVSHMRTHRRKTF